MTGVSNGGGMSARMACDAADLLSAAAPVAGGYGSLPDCHPSRPVAILEIHGTDDQVVPYAGKGAAGSAPCRASSRGGAARRLPRGRGAPLAGARRRRAALVAVRGATAVVHERVLDAEHGWPGDERRQRPRRFSSTAQTWAFLSSSAAERAPRPNA